MKRDLSKAQFEYRATKLGFKKGNFMGYWSLASNPSVHVSVWNAGKRNRDRLRYLIACDNSEKAKQVPSVPEATKSETATGGSSK